MHSFTYSPCKTENFYEEIVRAMEGSIVPPASFRALWNKKTRRTKSIQSNFTFLNYLNIRYFKGDLINNKNTFLIYKLLL